MHFTSSLRHFFVLRQVIKMLVKEAEKGCETLQKTKSLPVATEYQPWRLARSQ